MSRFFRLIFACMLLAATSRGFAQQVDVAVGGNTLWSAKNTTAEVGFLPPAEKGGVYPSVSLQYILPNGFGFNAEGSFRYKRTIYNDFQPYRPFLYDVNGVYAPRLSKK